ncbi:hypothetical protein URH17368_2777 [Alicyclobacillus hesperidum URH17-3-68]|nr:hypothetical protein URH17368_2777 [Alicyclobacillus hesperidum URH17-3-68]
MNTDTVCTISIVVDVFRSECYASIVKKAYADCEDFVKV